MTELGGAQISNLMETLPGIALVLRSPVADAFVHTLRLASRSPDFAIGEAEEILSYAVRRNLMSADESDRLLTEIREQVRVRGERAAAKSEARTQRKAEGASKSAAKAKAPVKGKAAVKGKSAAPASKPKATVKAKAKAAPPPSKAKTTKPKPKPPARKR